MAGTSPTRVDGDLYASAAAVGEVMSRSAAQQINHWARLGRELEAASSLDHRDIAEVLSGEQSYDALSVKEQAVVRARWAERMAILRGSLDLESEAAEAGRPVSEVDSKGNVVRREAKPKVRRLRNAS